jgi:hypothetical protein
MKADIDIIIVTKDRYDTLLRCVEYILRNLVLPRRIIIVHAQQASLCRTKKKIIRLCLEKKTTLIYRHVHDYGISYSRNIGVSLVKSSIFGFIDDDELPPINWISNAMHFLSTYKNISVVSGPKLANIRNNYWNNVWVSIYAPEQHSSGIVDFATSSNTFYRTKVFREHNITYDIEFATSSEDRVVSHKLLAAKAVIYYWDSLYVFHDFRKTMRSFVSQWFDYGLVFCSFSEKYRHVVSIPEHILDMLRSTCGIRSIPGHLIYAPGLIICDLFFSYGYIKGWLLRRGVISLVRDNMDSDRK